MVTSRKKKFAYLSHTVINDLILANSVLFKELMLQNIEIFIKQTAKAGTFLLAREAIK